MSATTGGGATAAAGEEATPSRSPAHRADDTGLLPQRVEVRRLPAPPRGPVPQAPARALPAAHQPTGPGRAPVIGVLLGLLLLALAVVLVRDGLVGLGALGGTGWLAGLAGGVGVLRPSWPWYVGGGVAVLLGLYLLGSAFARRTRRTVGVRPGPDGVAQVSRLHRRDVARLATGAAEQVDGVLSASSDAGRRSVVVTVSSTGDPSLVDRVRSTVGERLAPLDPTPAVRVRARSQSSSTKKGGS